MHLFPLTKHLKAEASNICIKTMKLQVTKKNSMKEWATKNWYSGGVKVIIYNVYETGQINEKKY